MNISFDPLNPIEAEFVRRLLDDTSPDNSLAEPVVANNTGTVASGFLHLSPEGDGGSDGAATVTAAPAVEKAKRGRKPKAAQETVEVVEETQAAEPEVVEDAGSKELTLDDARAALLKYNTEHGMDAAIELVRTFGAARISELDPSRFAEFIKAANQ